MSLEHPWDVRWLGDLLVGQRHLDRLRDPQPDDYEVAAAFARMSLERAVGTPELDEVARVVAHWAEQLLLTGLTGRPGGDWDECRERFGRLRENARSLQLHQPL